MKAYLAASFTRLLEMREKRDELEELGVEVLSRWIDRPPDSDNWETFTEDECLRRSMEDWIDIESSDLVILFTEKPSESKGGRYTEYGMALVMDKKIVIVGPAENIFHFLPKVVRYKTWEEFKENFFVYK